MWNMCVATKSINTTTHEIPKSQLRNKEKRKREDDEEQQKQKEKEAAEDLKQAAAEGHALDDELRDEGMEEDLYEDMDEVYEDSEEKIIEERSAVYPKHHGKER